MGQGNWNIPHGKYPEEHSGELFIPKNEFTDEKTYEYKFDIDSTYNRDDAIQFCARYGMSQASKITFRQCILRFVAPDLLTDFRAHGKTTNRRVHIHFCVLRAYYKTPRTDFGSND